MRNANFLCLVTIPVWTFCDCTYRFGLQKHRSVHKMPWEGYLQGHSEISGRVLGHFADIFTLILHGYESGEWHSYRTNTQ